MALLVLFLTLGSASFVTTTTFVLNGDVARGSRNRLFAVSYAVLANTNPRPKAKFPRKGARKTVTDREGKAAKGAAEGV
ncbi:hypothetical protein LTR49_028877, partial [Elasticomyces elasticus]